MTRRRKLTQDRQPLTYEWVVLNLEQLELGVVCQNKNLQLTIEERDSLNMLIALRPR